MLQKHPIRVNHIGFCPEAPKRFVLTENADRNMIFTVDLIIDARFKEVFSGNLTEVDDGFGNTVWTGDFSSITQEGSYVIRAGGFKSRAFVIYKRAYEHTTRVLLSYFTYQRCGSDLGYYGKCHLDDGYIKETGEHVDLSGGYHQSCDLRKSPAGVSIGVYGMIEGALRDKSSWGKTLFRDEVSWACDYFVKTIQENGDMYNTLNAPFGWEGRVFYKSPAPSSAAWNVVSCLAMGSLYFKDLDSKRSEKYLAVSKRAYNRLVSDGRTEESYRHPDTPPLGMDPERYYHVNCKKNSVADISQRAVASANLWLATRDEHYRNEVARCAASVAGHMLKGKLSSCICAGNGHFVQTVASTYSFLPGGLIALVKADDIGVANEYIKEKIIAAAESICYIASKTVWKTPKNIYSDADLDNSMSHVREGQRAPTIRKKLPSVDKIDDDENEIPAYYSHKVLKCSPSISIYQGLVLLKAYELTKNKKYFRSAQAIADNMMGTNFADSTNIVGQGYNHPNNPVSGQFFPHTPDIPGAVTIGYDDLDTLGLVSAGPEYDMPNVGLLIYYLSKLSEI